MAKQVWTIFALIKHSGPTSEHIVSDPQEVYTSVDNELYGDGGEIDHDYDKDQEVTQTNPRNMYDDPKETQKDKGPVTEQGYSKLQKAKKECLLLTYS